MGSLAALLSVFHSKLETNPDPFTLLLDLSENELTRNHLNLAEGLANELAWIRNLIIFNPNLNSLMNDFDFCDDICYTLEKGKRKLLICLQKEDLEECGWLSGSGKMKKQLWKLVESRRGLK